MDFKDLKSGKTNDDFWLKAKHDLVKILAEKTCSGKKGLRILNLGAGTGDDLSILNQFGGNYVVDVDKEALALIDDSNCVEKKFADACHLPYEDNFFDVTVSFDVFEHIADDHLAVSEVWRVLKPGGVLLFTVPAFQSLFSSHDRALQHYRRYSKQRVNEVFANFKTKKIFFWNSLLFGPMSLMRIIKKKSVSAVDQTNFSPTLNTIFYHLISVDNFLIKRDLSLPVGLSLVGWCYKQRK